MWFRVVVFFALVSAMYGSKCFEENRVTGGSCSGLVSFTEEVEVLYYFDNNPEFFSWITFYIKEDNETVAVATLSEKRDQSLQSIDVKLDYLKQNACRFKRFSFSSQSIRRVKFSYNEDVFNISVKYSGKNDDWVSCSRSHKKGRRGGHLYLHGEIAQASRNVYMVYLPCRHEDGQNPYLLANIIVSVLHLLVIASAITIIKIRPTARQQESPERDEEPAYEEIMEYMRKFVSNLRGTQTQL